MNGSRYLAAAVTNVGTLSWGKALAAAAVLAGVALLVGVIVILGRKLFAGKAIQPQHGASGQATQPDGDFIRSWIAITLVIGLISFCAFAFAVNDTTLRSTLIGGLIASVGSAIAFYFSSKSADKARQDIASAAAGTEMVPSLIGKSKDEATQALGTTTFRLIERPGNPPDDHVTEQHPPANTYAPRGSSVLVTLGTPPPSV
jgi:PASTA domain